MKKVNQKKVFLCVQLFVGFIFLFQFPGFAQQHQVDSLRKISRAQPHNYKITLQLFDALKKVNTDSAARFTTQLLIAGEDKNDSTFIAEAYSFKSALSVDQSKAEDAILFGKKALTYAQNKNDSISLALTGALNRNLGYTFSKLGKFNDAEPYYKNANLIFGSLKDSTSISNVDLWYGQLLKDLGRYDNALQVLFTGLRIAEKNKDDKLTGRILNNIANVYNGMGKYTDAISFYNQSIAFKIKSGQTSDLGNTYGNIGVTYYTMLQFDTALVYYRKSIQMKEKNNDRRGASTTINNIGQVFFEMGKYDSAEVYLLLGLKMRKEFADEQGIASSEAALGNLYAKLNQPTKALPYLEDAILLGEKNGAVEVLQRAYLASAGVYEMLGRYKDAYESSKNFINVTDSIRKKENLRQSEEMKAKYDAVKQDEKIKDLQNQKIQDDLKKSADEAEGKQNRYVLWGVGIIAMIIARQSFIRQRDQKKASMKLQGAYNEIETKNKNITDSIRYAQRIQRSILPDPMEFKKLLPNSFVFYQPKDIVSGDFWWIHETPGKEIVIAVADCTGHGVPGAFMSVMGTDILSQATKNKEINDSATALHFLDEGVRRQLKQTGGDDESRDGMDIAVAMIDRKKMVVQFAGALRPLLHVRDGKLVEYPGARFSIGGAFSGKKQFVNHEIAIQSGDMIYLFTDGFSDQFGGPKGKKFKTSKLKEILLEISALTADEQHVQLENIFNNWKGELEQVDDICVAGIRI